MTPTGIAVDARQAGDAGPAVERGDLEERAFVDDELDEALGVVHPARVARHERRQQLVVAPVDRVGRRRRAAPARRRSTAGTTGTGGSAPNASSSVAARLSTTPLDPSVDLRAAELLLGDVVAERRLDDRRAAREHLACRRTITFQWARQVCSAAMPAAAPSTADTTGTVFSSVHVDVREAVAVGQVGAAELLEAAHAAAGGVEQPDVRQPPLERPLAALELLAEAAAVRRSPSRRAP